MVIDHKNIILLTQVKPRYFLAQSFIIQVLVYFIMANTRGRIL